MSDSEKTELTFKVLAHISLEEIKQKYNIAQKRAEDFEAKRHRYLKGDLRNTPLPERLHFKYGAITKQIVEFWKEVVEMKENQTPVKPLTRKQERHHKKLREVPYDFGPGMHFKDVTKQAMAPTIYFHLESISHCRLFATQLA